jgi:hypothetical protein
MKKLFAVAPMTLAAAVGIAFLPTQESEAARGIGLCDAEPAELASTPQRRGRFETLPDVALSQKVEDKLNAIAASYQKRTGKAFVVTSGTRAPGSQAEIIFDKLQRGEDLSKLYRDKAAVAELKRVYDEAKTQKRGKDATVALITAAIRAQMKRGIFISAHLRAGAADVRSTSMDGDERRAFVDAARDVGGVTVIFESTPPHFHLQMD